MSDPQSSQDELLRQLATLERALADLLGVGAPEAVLAPLRQQVDQVRQELSGTGVQVGRDQTVQGDLVIGDRIDRQVRIEGAPYVEGDVTIVVGQAADRILHHLGTPQVSSVALHQATAAYYQALLDRHLYLNMKGMGVADRVPLRLPLLDVYVSLQARLELPEGETWRRGLRLAGRGLSRMEAPGSELRMSEPVAVLDLLEKHAGLIILGDPGAGKTTFLKFLALKLALGQGADLNLGERLPVLLPLSAYANALSTRDVPLNEFIPQYYADLGADLPLGQMLTAALDAGTALVLLDGLDEVKDLALRHIVIERVTDFYTFRRHRGNKFVLTSRVVGYRAVRPTAEGLAECTLVDFDDDEIAAFVGRWTAALERQAQGATATAATDAARERQELLYAIQRNPSVRRLAANPLLLTILALMKRQGVTLPERRVELYDQYVTTLLATWNRARGLGRPPSRDLDVVQTLRVLAPLALWMHEVNPGVGLVKREDLRRRLVALFSDAGEQQPDRAVQQFLNDVHEHAGLLLERGPEEYGFIHLTFEEYLAAVAIALEGQGDCRSIVARLAGHVGDPAWREVTQLTIGYLGVRQQLPKVAGDVVEALAREQPGAPGEATVLAGEAVLDAWPGGVPPSSKAAVIAALAPTMQATSVPASLRRRAGLLLGRLGWLPSDLDEFVEVSAGEFLYGEDRQIREIPYRYWIGKYPVTNAQYSRFLAADGYEQQEWWSEHGWAWRPGGYTTTVRHADERRWLAQRSNELRNRPFWWQDIERGNSLLPVVGICFFEAAAYCNWLSSQLHELPVTGGKNMPTPPGYGVRLPTEEEWERAARGRDGQEYPWSGDFDLTNANVYPEQGKAIGATAVCAYPRGVSPTGAWDMSGNVWEWTCSLWSPRKSPRLMRGGSWRNDKRSARCAVSVRRAPELFYSNIGFRIVVSPTDADF